MKCENAFDPLKELMNDPNAYQTISQIPVINLPANTNPSLAQTLINNAAQQTPVTLQKSLQLKELYVSIESAKCKKSIYIALDIHYWRKADMSLGINCTISGQDWA